MVVTHEIGSYRVLLITGYAPFGGKQIGFVYFNEPGGKYIGYVGIIKDGTALPANVRHANGVLNIYFHEAELVALLDTLRTEKPAYVKFHTDLKWGSVGTGLEPLGEQEAPAAP
jgi:hypothetical protein